MGKKLQSLILGLALAAASPSNADSSLNFEMFPSYTPFPILRLTSDFNYDIETQADLGFGFMSFNLLVKTGGFYGNARYILPFRTLFSLDFLPSLEHHLTIGFAVQIPPKRKNFVKIGGELSSPIPFESKKLNFKISAVYRLPLFY